MRPSLIITTYNWKEALELSILSAFKQSELPTEIIIADDGSTQETKDIVDQLSCNAPCPLIHSWQQDKGFRLSRSRNKAIVSSTGDYIILIDGDIVLDKHFIADHIRAAKPDFSIQGSRAILNEQATKKAFKDKNITVCATDRNVENKKNCIRSNLLSKLFSFTSKKLSGVRTCNFAFWKQDAIAVNGFNEEFIGWGREDSEFTARLLNNGIKRQNIKFNAVTYHLYHTINSRKHLTVNDAILLNTCKNKLTWCEKGLSQHSS